MIPSLNGNSILSGKSKKNNDIVYQYLQLKHKYLQSKYAVVLAYMPGKKTEYNDYSDAMLPEGIESVHPHYAISWRNNWMLRQSDFVVTYITHSWGGAYQYAEKARRQKKIVINL